MKTKANEDELAIEWTRGYVCAVANIINTHGEDTVAKDVLRGAGKIDWSKMNSYDRDTLLKVGVIKP